MIRWRAAARRPREMYAAARRQYDKARDVARGLSLDLAASTEVRHATLRTLAEMDDRLRIAEAAMANRVDDVLREQPELADGHLRRLTGASLDELTPGAANLLTFEHGSTGFQAQAGLWINSPLWMIYEPGRVYVHEVNERIVETPYALAAAQSLPRGARILDVGACDSTTALSLASLGYDVTAIDVRRYPFTHDNLTVVEGDLFAWTPEARFDAVLCVSTIEHVGLGWYGDPRVDDGDALALARIRDAVLRPGGVLVLTVPFGEGQAGEHQRTYGVEGLTKLLDGWVVDDQQILVRDDEQHWATHDGSDWPGVGVALVTAHNP